MTLEILQKDMIAAMKSRDKNRKDVLSSLVSAVKKSGIDNMCRDNIPEDMVNAAILKEAKLVKEQIDTCPDERAELKQTYKYRYSVIMEYAPKQLTLDEIKDVIRRDFADALATKQQGQIMKVVMPALKGKADGKLISQAVKELIS